jgi:hypothetical protein
MDDTFDCSPVIRDLIVRALNIRIRVLIDQAADVNNLVFACADPRALRSLHSYVVERSLDMIAHNVDELIALQTIAVPA